MTTRRLVGSRAPGQPPPWGCSGMTLRSQPLQHPRETPWVPPGDNRWFPGLADWLGAGAGEPAVLGQRCLELPARGYLELREHVAQVPLDCARADEQLRADLWVRHALTREPGDLLLLRRELLVCPGATFPHLLAGCHQLTAGAFGERLH